MALNAIQIGVDSKQSRLIATVELTKEAWDTLQLIHKGSKEGEDHISEPDVLITLLKNTIVGGQKQEVPEEVSTNVQTCLVPAPVLEDVRTLSSSDEEEDEISDEELAQSYKVLYEN